MSAGVGTNLESSQIGESPGAPRGSLLFRAAAAASAIFLLLASPALVRANQAPKRDIQNLESDRLKKQSEQHISKKAPSDLIRKMERSRRTREAVDENLAEQIDTLQMLIDAADPSDPDLPKYLLTLGDVYWDKADTFYDRAYNLDFEQQIYDAEEAKNIRLAKKLRAKQLKFLRREKKWRGRAIQVYRSIETRFPNYPRLDMVYYYLGYQLLQLNQKDDARDYFVKILKLTNSRYKPDALYHIGDYYFDKNEFDTALTAYTKVEEFPRAVSYAMALYKQGWCLYNTGDYEQALKRFLRVILYAKSEDAKDLPFRLELERDARQDLVRAYAEVAQPARAIKFFEKIAPDIKYELAETLAQMFFTEGAWSKSIAVYKALIKARKDSPRRALYWLGVAENAYHEGDKEVVVETVRRLMKNYRDLVEQIEAKDRDELTARLEGLIKTAATAFHREAERLNDPETYEFTTYLYEAYLAIFVNATDAYEVTWNLAVLNEQIGKWDTAAAMYEKVLEIQPDGDHASDAAKSILLAHYQSVENDDTSIKDIGEINLDPIPYPEKHQKVLEAALRYIRISDGGEPDTAKAHFVVAKTAYRFNHYDEALTALNTLIENYPDDPLAPTSARMVLSCFNLMHDVDNLEAYANKFAADPNINQGALAVLIQKIRDQAGFNRCFKFEKEKAYVETAKCFENYVREFPTTKLKTRAYFHAAAAYNRAKLIEKALTSLEDLYDDVPNDPMAPIALYSIAEILRSIAVYSESARVYELYAQYHPKHKYVRTALKRAIIFRRALRNYKNALKDIDIFIRLFPKDEAIPRLYLDRAVLSRDAKKKKVAERLFTSLLKKPPKNTKPEILFKARLELGRMMLRGKKKKKARGIFSENVKIYHALPEDKRRNVSAAGVAAIAESHFLVGNMVLKDMGRLRFKGNAKAIGKTLVDKLKLIQEANAIFAKVVTYGNRNWSIAGIARTAKSFETLADDIINAPVPSNFRGEAKEIYRQTLSDQAEPIRAKAIESYRDALRLATEQRWFNNFSQEAVEALSRLDYSFAFLKEYAMRPTNMRTRGALPPVGSYEEADGGLISAEDASELNGAP